MIVATGAIAVAIFLMWVLPVVLFVRLGHTGQIIFAACYAIVWLGFVAWVVWRWRKSKRVPA